MKRSEKLKFKEIKEYILIIKTDHAFQQKKILT